MVVRFREHVVRRKRYESEAGRTIVRNANGCPVSGARSAEKTVLVMSREDDSHAEAHGEKTTE